MSYVDERDVVLVEAPHYSGRMESRPSYNSVREWLGLAIALGMGPLLLLLGRSVPGMMYGAAAAFYFFGCGIIVPLMSLIAVRWRLVAWQVAIVSIALSVAVDDRGMVTPRQLAAISFMFWAFGTVISSPLPILFILRPLSTRERFIYGAVIVAILGGIIAFTAWINAMAGT